MFSLTSVPVRFLRCRAFSKARQSAMTIVEAVGMIVIMGVMAGLAYPAIGGLRQAGLDQQAIGIAQALNQAQQTYNLRIAGAATNWTAAADAASKYQLISPYVPFAADTLSDYTPAGYTLTLGPTLSTEVGISGPNGTVSY